VVSILVILKKVLGKEFDLARVDGAFIKTSDKKFHRLTKSNVSNSDMGIGGFRSHLISRVHVAATGHLSGLWN